MAGFNPLAALYAGMKIKKGPAPISARTPSFAGGMYKPPADPGNPIALGPDSGYTPEQADLRATIARPPQEGVKPDGTKIGGLRRVLGEIASNVGPLIGGPAVAGIGEKLLHPGLEKWNADVARKQALAQMSVDARNHQDLQQNRKFQEQTRLDNQADKEQAGVDRVEGKGGWQVKMPQSQASLSTRLYQPPEEYQPSQPGDVLYGSRPHDLGDFVADGGQRLQLSNPESDGGWTALKVPTLGSLPTNRTSIQQSIPNVEDQTDARTGKRVGDVGDVEWLNTPGTQGKQNRPFVRPSQQTLQEMEVRKRTADLEAAKTETLSDAEAQQYNDLGFKGDFRGKKMTSADARALREDIKGRLNSRDTIAAKPDPVSKQNENEWIATVNDPNSDPAAVTVAQANLKRLHDERAAQRVPPDPTLALDRITARFSKPHEKSMADADAQLEKIEEAKNMVNGSAAAQAVAIPKILTAVVSGQGSGVRITQAELNSLAHARGIAGDFEGWARRLAGQGTLTPEQQRQFTQVLEDVKARVIQKRAIAKRALDSIDGAASRDEAVRFNKEARDALEAFATGGGATVPTQTGIPKVGETFNGGKVLKVTPITSK